MEASIIKNLANIGMLSIMYTISSTINIMTTLEVDVSINSIKTYLINIVRQRGGLISDFYSAA